MTPQPTVTDGDPATDIETRVANAFKRDTAKHVLTVLHEDGLYRHLRLSQPDSGQHWFDLVTWPSALTIKGDMGSYTFSRDRDMLDFFRRSAWHGGPNLSYWEEKLDAADARSGVRAYSEELLRQYIADDVTACAETDLDARLREQAEELGVPGDTKHLPPSVVEECQTANQAYMDGLREELDDELLGEYTGWYLEDEGDALAGVRQFSYRPDSAPRDEQPFSFDPTEWTVTAYTWHYVWCCHAIVWGIAAYDRARDEQLAPVPVGAAAAAEG